MDDAQRPASPGPEEVERLYQAARTVAPTDRAAFVEAEAGDDPSLAQEVLSLLEHAGAAEGFFQRLGERVRSRSGPSGEWSGTGKEPSVPVGGDVAPGAAVGRYRIVERIASGGMGTVYRARDGTLDREVALKLLPHHLALHPGARERFFLEARAAAALDHPNVCTVHEVGEAEDGRPFLAMALYRGETLKERLARGPLPVEEAVACASAIARGLEAAHARGIVHRDVKPGNVMLTADGAVKLLDFGVAKVADVTLTRPGFLPGTVAYMSPEQVRGRGVDHRTDLWSLGVVLYEMLTEVRPFGGGGDRAVLNAIAHEEPEDVRSLRPETPEPLGHVVERLLQKDPDDRFGSAEEVIEALQGHMAVSETGGSGEAARRTAHGPRSLRSLGRRPSILAAVVVVLATFAALLWRSPGGVGTEPTSVGPDPETPSVAVLPFVTVGGEPDDAFLADGMTEELIGMLARTGGLRVIASTSVFGFRDRALDVRTVADSLGVRHVVEGGLQRVGPVLRVRVRLVDGREGSTRWSETYDRELQDVFAVQDEIARAVAGELGVRLGAPAATVRSRPPTRNLAAYELYLRGNDPVLLRSDTAALRGLEYFRKAVELDPGFAAAWAGLARLTVRVGPGEESASWDEVFARAEEAALRAVALDESLGEAHGTLGAVRMGMGKLASGEAHLKRAIALDPGRARTHEWLVTVYLQTGRPAEALAEAERGLALDPLSPSATAELARALAANDRCDEALARLEELRELQPPLLRAAPIAARCHARKERWPEAIAMLRPQAEAGGAHAVGLLGHLLARSGEEEEALQVLEGLLDRWREPRVGAFPVAVVYAGLGDLDRAFLWLDRAVEDRSMSFPLGSHAALADPLFDELRRDPRYEGFKERLGLQNL